MKVLMVTPTYFPITGGAETAIRRLTLDLNQIGIQTDVLTFNMDKVWKPKWHGRTEISGDGFRVFKIAGFNWMPFPHSSRNTMGVNLLPSRFTNLFKDYDIVHFHGDFSFPLFSYFSKKPKLFHFHGLDIAFFKRYFLGRFILKHVADLYISLTNQMKDELVEIGLPENKISFLPNGVDTGIFKPDVEKKEEGLLLFVGRITPGKGLHVLLQSLEYLKKPVRLVVIGPPDWDSSYFNNILQLIQKHNSSGKHKVEYIGQLEHSELVKWYQKASIFVLPPPQYEALGIVNLEALSCATPVVATKVGGISEVVHDGENGFLVSPNNATELARSIQQLLDDENLRRKFGEQGRKVVVKNYSNKVILKKLCKIYRELT